MLAFLRARALNRGLLGGSRTWVGVGALVWTVRLFQWLNRPETTVIYRERLDAGQAVEIRHVPAPPTRRERKKSAKKTAKETARSSRAERRAYRKAA
jgi:hypothetical protein